MGTVPDAAPRLHFDAVLRPHRSLSRRGFGVVMALALVPCCVAGAIFAVVGAWPITGFLGLDVLALWLAFVVNYRAGRLVETVQLSPEALTVRRIQPSGRWREWRFPPYWLRVEIDDPPQHDSALTLASHGRRLTIGAFLTPQERAEFAAALKAALARLHCRPEPLASGG